MDLKKEIEDLHLQHPAYGHRRVALALHVNRKRALRVMNLYGIKPPRRRLKRHYTTKSVKICNYTNLIKELAPVKPHQIYVSDLTYLKYQGKFIYLATVEDIFTREVVSAQLSCRHDSDLASNVVNEALSKNTPKIFHSDRGSEYMAQKVTSLLEDHNVKISVSDKGSPWQNGYKESFFDKFKGENGDLNRFETLGELIEEIYSYIFYYNTYRIHTKLKMSPLQFKQKASDFVSRKWGT